MNAELFLQGQKDCRDGVEHRSGKGDSYDRGFATQYELEAMLEARVKKMSASHDDKYIAEVLSRG